MGVKGMKFRPGDGLVAMEVVEPEGFLLVMSEKGFGKRTPLDAYRAKSRAGMGVATINKDALKLKGPLVNALVVQEKDEVTFISSGGIVLRLHVADISVQGRSTRGVTLMDLGEGDSLVAVARISE